MKSETQPSTETMKVLRELMTEAISSHFEKAGLETMNIDDVVVSMIQLAATMIATMPGDRHENVKWGIHNFTLALSGVLDFKVVFDDGGFDA